MIIQTTPEVAEGLFEHLQILGILNFQICTSTHSLISQAVKVFFILENIESDLENKLINLLDLYNELIPNQKTSIIVNIKEPTQSFWFPVKNYSLGFGKDSNIRLGKKKAFGSGLHPSTVLALRQIELMAKKHKYENFVDIGSGSGILSIYANLLGIKNIYAFEISDEAINSMKENFYLNNLDGNKIIFNPYLEDLKGLDLQKTLFVANMRPKELEISKEIIFISKICIISGLMIKEHFFDNFYNHKTFDEWQSFVLKL